PGPSATSAPTAPSGSLRPVQDSSWHNAAAATSCAQQTADTKPRSRARQGLSNMPFDSAKSLRLVPGDHLRLMSLDTIAFGRLEEGLPAARRQQSNDCLNSFILSINCQRLGAD